MTEKEQAALLIEAFTDLQRIKKAADRDKEIDYQIKIITAKLQALCIPTEDLVL